MPNSGFKSTQSPSEKMNCFFLSFLAVKMIEICCAATDKTGNSIRLNSSKHPQDPDCARPKKRTEKFIICCSSCIFDICELDEYSFK